MKIGVLSDCFRLGYRLGAQTAARVGAQGIQIYAVEGEMAPENLNAAARADALKWARGLGLIISAVCGDLGGGGFCFKEQNAARIERTKKIIDLALDLDCRIVTTHVGVVPENQAHPRFQVLADAMGEIGLYAQKKGAALAIETGPEHSETLKALLDAVALPSVGVNLDPANLLMTVNEDAEHAAKVLAPYTLHTHAKDGLFFKQADTEVMYGLKEAPEGYDESDYCMEVALGKGGVRFPAYLKALRDAGYDGFLTIERETGDDPESDIREAVGFLKEMTANL